MSEEIRDFMCMYGEPKGPMSQRQAELFLKYLGEDFSQRALAEYWGWSKTKVQRFLEHRAKDTKPVVTHKCGSAKTCMLAPPDFKHHLSFTLPEYEKLQEKFSRKRIDHLTEEILTWADENPTKFKKKKSHYRMLLNWDRNAHNRYGLCWMEDGPNGPGYYDESRMLRSMS